jgi:hypothetical protein
MDPKKIEIMVDLLKNLNYCIFSLTADHKSLLTDFLESDFDSTKVDKLFALTQVILKMYHPG